MQNDICNRITSSLYITIKSSHNSSDFNSQLNCPQVKLAVENVVFSLSVTLDTDEERMPLDSPACIYRAQRRRTSNTRRCLLAHA